VTRQTLLLTVPLCSGSSSGSSSANSSSSDGVAAVQHPLHLFMLLGLF
jgi:hypothetical protein